LRSFGQLSSVLVNQAGETIQSLHIGLYPSRMPTSPKPLIYLASASPRRSALLSQIGVEHRIQPVDIDERLLSSESPRTYVTRLARTKAETLWRRLRESASGSSAQLPVLGSDTTVAIGADVLGKPLDRADGLRMLERLSGQTHQVFTAVALCHEGGCDQRVNVSEVTFRALLPDEIAAYWDTGEPADKAGGYAVQGLAAIFIERVMGSYSGIMGLPLFETAELLHRIGWGLPAPIGDETSSVAAAPARARA
jgi:septum formation protein